MLNKRETEKEIRDLLKMMEKREETMKRFDLKDDDFYPFMFGWIESELKYIVRS